MDNYDVSPLVKTNTPIEAGNTHANPEIVIEQGASAQKPKLYLRWVSETIQKGLLWALFLYLPLYGLLLYFNGLSVISMFSLYYLISYLAIILLFIVANRQKAA